ncbi:MAG: ABC transporter permease [Gammaproteobacteria bacterium]|nr:ABC transporter permease [Gammaproteobacteria bacterium]
MKNSFFRAVTSLSLIIIFWQAIVSIFHLPNYIVPTPLEVFITLVQFFSTIMAQASITLFETVIGLLIGALFGILSAILLITIRPLRLFLLPLILLSQALPTFAIAPILVLWLGFGIGSKITMVVLMTFFPMTSALFDGFNKIPVHYLEMAKHMRGKKTQIMRYIYFPFALPYLASGLRVSVVIAPLGAIIGEWVGASQGLGYLLLNANARLETSLVFAALSVLVFMTLSLYYSIDKCLKRWITW